MSRPPNSRAATSSRSRNTNTRGERSSSVSRRGLAGSAMTGRFFGLAVAAACLVQLFVLTVESSHGVTSAAAVSSAFIPPPVLALTARTLRTYPVPEADQGVAVDSRYFYAVDNTVLAKYEIASGAFVNHWVGPEDGLIRHMNSC